MPSNESFRGIVSFPYLTTFVSRVSDMGSLHYYLQVVFEGISGHDKDAYLAIDNIKFIDCGEYVIGSDYQLCTYFKAIRFLWSSICCHFIHLN